MPPFDGQDDQVGDQLARRGTLILPAAYQSAQRADDRDACRAEPARAARAFVSAVLGPGHPCGDVAILLVSEIFSNSIRHSRSCAPGETVTVAVISGDGTVRVEVTDRAGPGTPEPRLAGRDAEGGRGLQLVAGLAAPWGWRRRGGRW